MKNKNKSTLVVLDVIQIIASSVALVVTLICAILSNDTSAKTLLYAGNFLSFCLLADGIRNLNRDKKINIKVDKVIAKSKTEILKETAI